MGPGYTAHGSDKGGFVAQQRPSTAQSEEDEAPGELGRAGRAGDSGNAPSPSVGAATSLNWQNVIWRECRHCGDREVAGRMFGLMAGEPAGRETYVLAVLAGALCGLFISFQYLLILIVTSQFGGTVRRGTTLGAVLLVVVSLLVGGLVGFFARYCLGRNLTWEQWWTRLGVPPAFFSLSEQLLDSSTPRPCAPLGSIVLIIQRLWRHGRPKPSELLAAVRTACELENSGSRQWTELLRQLDERLEHPPAPKSYVEAICSEDWRKRFVSMHTLIATGGEAAPQLVQMAHDVDPGLRRRAVAVLRQMGTAHESRANGKRDGYLCPRCLTRWDVRSVRVHWYLSVSYYGCRECGQNCELLECSHVVAVLDKGMDAVWLQEGDRVRVNVLAGSTLFDFDSVAVISVTDEEVEQFVMEVGNDLDEYRRKRYKDIQCTVSARCRLTENTLHLLRDIFGQITNLKP